MTVCRPPVPCPAIHHGEGDCDPVNHDATLRDGGIGGGDDALSAALMQLNIPAGSWWAASTFDFELGSRVKTATTDATRETAVRTALRPLVNAGLMDQPVIRTVQTVDGPVIDIDVSKGGRSLFGVKL